MRLFLIVFGILFIDALLFSTTCVASEERPYFYPYVNPFEATVMEVPPVFQQEVHKDIPVEVFKVYPFPERTIPEIFWYQNGLTCSLNFQKSKAPLIIVIAGTGSKYNSPTMKNLQSLLYQTGFHVLSITSPTYSEFVINASSSLMPGNLVEDAKDLYNVMQLALDHVKNDIKISKYFLTGYSLGGTQAAFVALQDDKEKRFDFEKVLLINPAVNIYNSVSRLDEMLLANVPGGIENFGSFIDDTLAKFAEASREIGYVELSGEYFYRLYRNYPPREDFLASLIGFAFRFDSSSMIFASDVMSGGGFVVPKDVQWNYTTSLTPYSMVLFRTGFVDYFNEYFGPYWLRKQPGLTMNDLKRNLSLSAIASFLKENKKIGLLHNEDDIILEKGEIEELVEIFGSRAKVFPTGGHLGNINHPDVARFMAEFFKGKGQK